MQAILKKIKNIISPKNKSIESELYDAYDESLIRIDRGQSFKGHEATLSISNINEESSTELYLGNKYLSGFVSYMFDNRKQTTRMVIVHHYVTPKWLKDKKSIINQSKNFEKQWMNWKMYNSYDNVEIEIGDYDINITKTITNPGLVMYGHRKNIERLKELTKIGSNVRSRLKSMTNKEITSLLKNEGDNYVLCA